MIVIGVDMALANMGLVSFRVEEGPDGVTYTPLSMKLVSTQTQAGKTVRKSSDTLRRAKHLVAELKAWCEGADLVCAEVPTGSQSAAAASALGVAVGVLASCPLVIAEVSPNEVKLRSVGKRDASKEEIRQWAYARWPQASWLQHNSKRTQANEHLADACAAVVAAYHDNPLFQLYLRARRETPSTGGGGPTPDQQPAGQLPVAAIQRTRNRVRTLPR